MGDVATGAALRSWQAAWRTSNLGSAGVYHRSWPSEHFTTTAMLDPSLLADGIAEVADAVAARRVVELGAGEGTLVAALARARPDLEVLGVDVRPPLVELPANASWAYRRPRAEEPCVLVAVELLDDLPVPVAEVDDLGERRHVLVDETGEERLGPRLDRSATRWVDAWWPISAPGERCEIGLGRDRWWQRVVRSSRGGAAVAIDYGHVRASRPIGGSLRAHARGRAVPCVPDGRRVITADVAMDSVAAVAGGGRLRWPGADGLWWLTHGVP